MVSGCEVYGAGWPLNDKTWNVWPAAATAATHSHDDEGRSYVEARRGNCLVI